MKREQLMDWFCVLVFATIFAGTASALVFMGINFMRRFAG